MTDEAKASPPAEAGNTGGVPSVPGRLTEAYDVQKAVGKGGYAVVYKGIRRQDGRVIAVKKVEIFEMTQKKRDRCLQEVTLLAQLNHPYIIQMLDAFIDENMLIIIFEWAPAGDLKRLIKKTSEAGKTLDEPAIWGFFSQPANVLVGANGALKLGDLGLGRQLSEQTMEAFSKVGTPYYVSPEVVRGAGYDWKSDVWSLGCLLYELACLRSPFEMEGANLYDVFQRISKGDYDPLPDEQFSPTLRNLIARMLSVDPAGRPELEEVWRISQDSLNAQAKARVDVHTAAERIYDQLMLLEALSLAPPSTATGGETPRSSKSKSKPGSGKKSKEVPKDDGGSNVRLPPPPTAALRVLHPTYFAESLAALPGGGGVAGLRAIGSEEAQKQQLGTFLQVFAWLLRVGGWHDLAEPVEQYIEVRARPTRTGTRGNSSRALPSPTSGSANGGHAPAPPPQRASVVVCTNLLKGAEAARRAAQLAGVPTEFSPVTAVAAGYGRATCTLLQDLFDASAQRVPLVMPRPRHKGSDKKGKGAEDSGGEDDGEDDGVGGPEGLWLDDGDGAVLTAASPLPAYRDDGDEEASEALWGGAGQQGPGQAVGPMDGDRGRCRPDSRGMGGRPDSRGAVANGTMGTQHGTGLAGGQGHDRIHGSFRPPPAPSLPPGAQPPNPQVDPVAWRLEAERLGPQLSRIKISASALGAGGLGEWAMRWDKVKASLKGLQQEAPPALTAMGKLAAGIGEQLERLAVTERRLNSNEGIAGLLEGLASRREKLNVLRQDVVAHEDLQQTGQAALSQLADRLAGIQQQIDERASGMDGAMPIKQLKEAVATVKKEMAAMELRLGVVRTTLMAKARKHQLIGQHAQVHDVDPDDDDDKPWRQ